ncbi:MAG: hypothetical protein HC936_07625 [Leptolyngbyaceae cyanobacterium SU_3_3]|nr:hypothetical protein [Leptolyngbyaceae cyanobacterium SU_3_3]NJR52999.1 hypothetical protein [Leptolyngbyaceae cyanobacterium CSU_1_3]
MLPQSRNITANTAERPTTTSAIACQDKPRRSSYVAVLIAFSLIDRPSPPEHDRSPTNESRSLPPRITLLYRLNHSFGFVVSSGIVQPVHLHSASEGRSVAQRV